MLDRSTIVTRSKSKKVKHQETIKEHCNLVYGPSLLSLSDDVLLIIFSYVDARDLRALSETCQRTANLSYDRTLWRRVDLRNVNLNHSELEEYLKFFQKSTKFLATCGPENSSDLDENTISKELLKAIVKTSPNLHTLILQKHVFDGSSLTLEDFPPTLEVLRFMNCHMKRMPKEKSYFYKMDKLLPNLKILDLSDNSWFVPHTLLALSKSVKLEELILRGCNVADCLPYASLAANFGFSTLKKLDLRNTSVSDIEVTCFNRTLSLRHLYLSTAPGTATAESYVTDYSITTFGSHEREIANAPRVVNVGEEAVIIEVGAYPRPVCHLETIYLRNYPGITDRTLIHAASSLKELKFIDVCNTGVTKEGLELFKKTRPRVKVRSNVH